MIRIRRLLLAACALVLAAAPAAAQPDAEEWRTDVPCTTPPPFGQREPAPLEVPLHHPQTAEVPGCRQARCVGLRNGLRVCACVADSLLVTRVDDDGRLLNEWSHDRRHETLGFTWMPSVAQGDLDGDGRPELIVAELVAVSNGLGVQYFDVRMVDGRDPARTPVRLSVEDYTTYGSLVRPASGGACRLIATRWQPLRDRNRGEGMYLVGQWMRYRDGRLEHDADRPVVVRRLLNSFERQAGGAPLSHLRDPRAEAWDGLPLTLPPLAGRRRGTILLVKDGNVDVAITPHETEVFYVLGTPHQGPDGTQTTHWLVDRATGRPYPQGYESADPRWLQLAPVEIVTYRSEWETVNLLVVGAERGGSR